MQKQTAKNKSQGSKTEKSKSDEKSPGAGVRFLITAGGTREYIDPVRFISNASSGQMGYALAKAAADAGGEVTLISAPTHLPVPKGVNIINVTSSAEMFEAVKREYANCDCLIMAAAVSDYMPAKVSKTKIKKSDEGLVIELKPTVDILKWAGEHKSGQVLVGFALEDRDIIARAYKKLQAKRLDMIVANSPAAIGARESSVYIIMPESTKELPESPKPVLAKKIVAQILTQGEKQQGV